MFITIKTELGKLIRGGDWKSTKFKEINKMNTKKKKKSSKSCYITKGYGKSNGRVLKDKLEASVNYKDRKNDP